MIVWSDASVKRHEGIGIGWELQTWSDNQNDLFRPVEKGYDTLSGNFTSIEAEVLAMTRGIKEALRQGERDYIRIRCDCKPLVEKIQNDERIDDGSYIEAVNRLLDRFDEYQIKWVKRSENSCADKQAEIARHKLAN